MRKLTCFFTSIFFYNCSKSRYYLEESLPDFYYGKGSTFPDINGSIGIIFEQVSSRGHAQET